MSGLVTTRNNKVILKDGEDNLPIHPDDLYSVKLGKVYEFQYFTMANTLYAKLIKILN